MSQAGRRAVIVAALLSAVLGIAVRAHSLAAAGEPEITPEVRAGTLNLDAVAPGDRAWILAVIAAARPEARRLIDEVDGLVAIDGQLNAPGVIIPGSEGAIGLARFDGTHGEISLDVRELDGERAIDRSMVVLHELGHIVEFTLVDDELLQQLDAGIPPAGPCQSVSQDDGACTAIEERFADTFAKWALRGRFSLAGSGYGIPTPPSLEDWGTPLSRLAYELDIKARKG
jgi:hypothetical protein